MVPYRANGGCDLGQMKSSIILSDINLNEQSSYCKNNQTHV